LTPGGQLVQSEKVCDTLHRPPVRLLTRFNAATESQIGCSGSNRDSPLTFYNLPCFQAEVKEKT
jgi:hypothetical protein